MRKETVPGIVFKFYLAVSTEQLLNHGESLTSCFEKRTTEWPGGQIGRL